MAEPVVRTTSKADMDDEAVLASLGYKQELRRDWGLAHNFGISFSIIVSLAQPSLRLLPYSKGTVLNRTTVSYHRYHHTLQLWIEYWWTRR